MRQALKRMTWFVGWSLTQNPRARTSALRRRDTLRDDPPYSPRARSTREGPGPRRSGIQRCSVDHRQPERPEVAIERQARHVVEHAPYDHE